MGMLVFAIVVLAAIVLYVIAKWRAFTRRPFFERSYRIDGIEYDEKGARAEHTHDADRDPNLDNPPRR